MNERIKQLAEQCGFKSNPDIYDRNQSFDIPKFAELIVRECANQCDLLLDHKISSEWARGTHDCSKAIKKHFGVEE
jgi:hypothetical protein